MIRQFNYPNYLLDGDLRPQLQLVSRIPVPDQRHGGRGARVVGHRVDVVHAGAGLVAGGLQRLCVEQELGERGEDVAGGERRRERKVRSGTEQKDGEQNSDRGIPEVRMSDIARSSYFSSVERSLLF